MALDANRLANALRAAILAAIPSATEINPVTSDPDDTLQEACLTLATEIVDEVASNLAVAVPAGTVIISAPSGVINPTPIVCTVA